MSVRGGVCVEVCVLVCGCAIVRVRVRVCELVRACACVQALVMLVREDGFACLGVCGCECVCAFV